MDIPPLFKWFKGIIIALSVCALVMTFTPFPGHAFVDWFLLASGLCSVGVVAALALRQGRDGQRGVRNFLFDDRNAAILWLVVRMYLGGIWLQNGLAKVFGSGWTNGGSALRSFWLRAVNGSPGGHSQIPYPWYRDLLHLMLAHQVYTWFAWVITISELSIGLLLILGLCTGLAACAGGGLNLLYLLAGSISVNPVMLIFSLFLLLAWRVAGYYGLDRFLFPTITQCRAAFTDMKRRISEAAAYARDEKYKRQISALIIETPNRFE